MFSIPRGAPRPCWMGCKALAAAFASGERSARSKASLRNMEPWLIGLSLGLNPFSILCFFSVSESLLSAMREPVV